MAIPCHPPPGSPAGSSSRDPYKTLGLAHNASLAQIKVAYRKLALRYHPDRQRPTSPTIVAGGDGGESTTSTEEISSRDREASTAKFAEVAAAYAILSDTVRKKEYDHLYKFGAFDNAENQGDRANGDNANTTASAKAAATPTNNNYQYTENLSGGYYKPGYKPPTKASTTATQSSASAFQQQAAAAFQSMQSQDSFFDDLIYSPRSKGQTSGAFAFDDDEKHKNNDKPSATTNNANDGGEETDAPQRKSHPGIGFSFTPLGKHLSVHVPSRNEVMASMTQQPPVQGNKPRSSHLFGTRVTFSQQTTSSARLDKLEQIATCGASNASSLKQKKPKVVTTTTTRIAKGQKRIVKRTAHLHSNGRKEVVIEENGVVRRRYVEENPNISSTAGDNNNSDGRDDSETTPGHNTNGKESEEGTGGLQKEDSGKFTLLGLFKSCLAPCASVTG